MANVTPPPYIDIAVYEKDMVCNKCLCSIKRSQGGIERKMKVNDGLKKEKNIYCRLCINKMQDDEKIDRRFREDQARGRKNES